MTEQGIKKAELARRLGWHIPQVDRLFDLRHASRLDQIETAPRTTECGVDTMTNAVRTTDQHGSRVTVFISDRRDTLHHG
jgi:hypothetical protein